MHDILNWREIAFEGSLRALKNVSTKISNQNAKGEGVLVFSSKHFLRVRREPSKPISLPFKMSRNSVRDSVSELWTKQNLTMWQSYVDKAIVIIAEVPKINFEREWKIWIYSLNELHHCNHSIEILIIELSSIESD